MSFQTAISRKKTSAPASWLVSKGLVKGKVLDFGCGKGDDARINNWAKYDPHYSPDMPKGKFDTIVCTYVLNVVENVEEVIAVIKSKLSSKGKAYISVRRDLPKRGQKGKGCYQRYVELDLPVLKENGNFCLYQCER